MSLHQSCDCKVEETKVLLRRILSCRHLYQVFRAGAIKTDGNRKPTYYVGFLVSVRFHCFLPGINFASAPRDRH